MLKLYFYIECREIQRNKCRCNTDEHTRHFYIKLVNKPLYCLVKVILPFLFQNLMFIFPPLPRPSFYNYFNLFAPPNPSEVTTISTRMNQSSILILCWCHRVSVFISNCSSFTWSWLFGAGIVGGVVLV